MSVSEKFSNFNSNIRIPSTNKNTISSRYKQITKRLNSDFYGINSETSNSLYVGSYWRDTDIHVSDIDILFILPSTIYKQ
jgi:UTP:GlnB (protein PII) uridylyltransferase